MQGVKVAMRQEAASSPTLASLPPPHKSASSSIRCPRLWLWGAGAWQPSGECPRRAPKPAPPLRKDSLPLLFFMERGRLEHWILTVGSGPSAGRGPSRLSCPFWRSSSGRCPLLPLGPEREASQRRPCFCSGLLPSPPGAAGLQLALKGGQARGRGAPGARAPVGSEPRAPSLDGCSCLRERVCGHCSGGGGRARSGPRDP